MAKIKLTTKQKKICLSIILLVVIIVGCLVAFMKLTPDESKEDDTQSPVVSETIERVQAEAAEYTESGDTEGGLLYYDDQVAGAESSTEKQILLVYKAYFAFDAGNYDAAIDAAKQADAISSTPTTMTVLAKSYELKGDKEQALIYYKKLNAIKQPDDGGMTRDQPNQSWEDKIRELEQ